MKEARQEAFINALQNDPALQAGDDLLQISLEALKNTIQDKLTVSRVAEGPDIAPDITRIYLIYDQRDLDDIEPLEDYLYNQEVEVLRPLFKGKKANVSEEHQENLCSCDAVLIYYGRGSEAWLRGKSHDLLKAPGYRHATPISAKAIYVAGPEDRQQARIRTKEVDAVIKNFGNFSPDELVPFFAELKQTKGKKD
jgi:hypothetical protein